MSYVLISRMCNNVSSSGAGMPPSCLYMTRPCKAWGNQGNLAICTRYGERSKFRMTVSIIPLNANQYSSVALRLKYSWKCIYVPGYVYTTAVSVIYVTFCYSRGIHFTTMERVHCRQALGIFNFYRSTVGLPVSVHVIYVFMVIG